ncbi:putative RNA recognition motif protein [Monocercomonoides exilis]|uniref:putative RNA recognition motif protein n=1 Tax=Monocercomonoides exilis TaxID=2049356 RepID=UPI003559E3DD|nr:putative RNA recognition motif protein [Monocercomonoides exilis]|eukprot:MONOS_6110.1-p1 / transcript=MONOS_6110.1 / gene=MONOS_6110 / organism=Monocercomonoides_exilis_PA203 / gene_product=unspecified product / transcript_product=unspecified product / location=Mono_scaffold00188:42570-43363(-) / protein_length=248 / sequence_SO=supercontig / SO=protein_coding / is_pseudo=false
MQSSTALLWVGGLDKRTDAVTLGHLFETVGFVKAANIAIEDNVSKGFGYVEMESPVMAERAKTKLNGALVDGRNIKVAFMRPGGLRDFEIDPSPPPDRIREYSQIHGWIDVPTSREDEYSGRRSKQESTQKAAGKSGVNKAPREEKSIEKSGLRGVTTTTVRKVWIHIGNLPYQMKIEDLLNSLSKYRVKSIRLPKMEANPVMNVGYGFVELVDEAEREKLLLENDQILVLGRSCRVRPAVTIPVKVE